MKKKLLSLLLLVSMIFSVATACEKPSSSSDSSSESTQSQMIDYAAQVKLDMNSETLKEEVTVHNHIDGDTTHFNISKSIVSTGILKARYLAVNTPESTGKIEEWGKKASKYTKETLMTTGTNIIIETDGTDWAVDSTGERYLVWIWYKHPNMSDYRCLNIELLQNGLAVGSKASATRYGEICVKAIDQASVFGLHVHSQEKDPDYYYGEAQKIDLKELRLNTENYKGTRVAFEGYVSQYYNNGVYVEDYDSETDMYYGMYVYYGFYLDPLGKSVLDIGNHVLIVGNVEYYEVGGTYQVCDLKYNAFKPNDPDNIKIVDDDKLDTAYPLTSITTFLSDKTITITTENESGEATQEEKTFPYAQLAMNSSISMDNLCVQSAYTTNNGGENDGAISLTCTVDGKTFTVRTMVLYNEDGSVVTQDIFVSKTISVKGVVDYYNGNYQIKVFSLNDIQIQN